MIEMLEKGPRLAKAQNAEVGASKFCPGCGHGMILKTLAQTIDELEKVIIEDTHKFADKLGGAIANVNPGGSGNQLININGALFSGNSAGENGGAIYNADRGIISFTGDNVFNWPYLEVSSQHLII